MTAGYRGDGLRAWKQGAGGRTYYLYDGELPVVELDAAGAVAAVNTFGGAALVSRRSGTQSTFYTFDPQGSVAQRTDASGAVISSHLFNAHGGELTAPGAGPFGYGARWGYYTDQETGLQLLTHRYYDPAGGRFLTRDPISYRGGINLYAYTKNNPVNRADPSGLDDADYPAGNPTGLPEPNPWYWSHNESADNPPESYGPGVAPNVWVSGELGGGVHVTVSGLNGGGGGVVNLATGETCTYVKGCMRFGYGVMGSVGAKGGASVFGPRCGKDLGGPQFEGVAELDSPAGGGSVSGGYGGGLGAGIGLKPSWGLGFSLGIDVCGVHVLKCYNSPPECRSCN